LEPSKYAVKQLQLGRAGVVGRTNLRNGTGPSNWSFNEVEARHAKNDADGDGLGDGLEAGLGTCADRWNDRIAMMSLTHETAIMMG